MLAFWSRTSSLQICENINFCHLSHPVNDILLMAARAKTFSFPSSSNWASNTIQMCSFNSVSVLPYFLVILFSRPLGTGFPQSLDMVFDSSHYLLLPNIIRDHGFNWKVADGFMCISSPSFSDTQPFTLISTWISWRYFQIGMSKTELVILVNDTVILNRILVVMLNTSLSLITH